MFAKIGNKWPELESHVEIEGHSEEAIMVVSDKLGLDWQKRILHLKVELYGKIYGLTDEGVHKRIESLTFEDNPFANLSKKVYTFPYKR